VDVFVTILSAGITALELACVVMLGTVTEGTLILGTVMIAILGRVTLVALGLVVSCPGTAGTLLVQVAQGVVEGLCRL
jgi:hypothetical protein